MEQEHPAWILPEMELLSKMIEQAVMDLDGIDQRRAEAIEWLTDKDATESDVMSFKWIVWHLGLDLGGMNERIAKAIKRRELGQPASRNLVAGRGSAFVRRLSETTGGLELRTA